jgi:polyisoprenoid-binding protein YceI
MSDVKYCLLIGALCALSGSVAGCKDKPKVELAPVASALVAAPVAATAVTFSVDSASSKVTFLMDSPLEKIDGDASGGLQGDLSVDLSDLSKSTALVKVDLQKLVLYQQKREGDKSEYGQRAKNDLQNTHARNWLQIVPREGDVTAEQAEANRWVEFKIDKLENASVTNVAGAMGDARTLTATATGDFRLHGRKQTKSAKLEITVNYQGNKAQSIHVKTTEPLKIGLEEFEVNPRDDAGKFVKSVTEALSSNLKGKVAQQAPVLLDFTANAK